MPTEVTLSEEVSARSAKVHFEHFEIEAFLSFQTTVKCDRKDFSRNINCTLQSVMIAEKKRCNNLLINIDQLIDFGLVHFLRSL